MMSKNSIFQREKEKKEQEKNRKKLVRNFEKFTNDSMRGVRGEIEKKVEEYKKRHKEDFL